MLGCKVQNKDLLSSVKRRKCPLNPGPNPVRTRNGESNPNPPDGLGKTGLDVIHFSDWIRFSFVVGYNKYELDVCFEKS